MTPYSGLGFFFTLALALLPAATAGLRGKNLRVCGFAVTAVMLLLIFDTPRKLLTLALFWAWQLALIFSYLHVRKKSEKRYVLWIFLLLSLLPLIFTKLSVFVKELSVFSMLGISYVSFRAVQILVEIYDGHLTKLCPLDVSYFLLFFPSILSGPLDRYQRFSADLQKTGSPEDYEALLREGLWRLATGAIYNFVLGNLIWQYWVSCMPDTLLGTLGYMYGYTLFMFFNFAGTAAWRSERRICSASSSPENFNQPFRSVDMKDFWSRWHISLSTFLRDYVYTRFCMAALRGKWIQGTKNVLLSRVRSDDACHGTLARTDRRVSDLRRVSWASHVRQRYSRYALQKIQGAQKRPARRLVAAAFDAAFVQLRTADLLRKTVLGGN